MACFPETARDSRREWGEPCRASAPGDGRSVLGRSTSENHREVRLGSLHTQVRAIGWQRAERAENSFGRASRSPRWMTRESTERRRATAAARTHAVGQGLGLNRFARSEHAFDTMAVSAAPPRRPRTSPTQGGQGGGGAKAGGRGRRAGRSGHGRGGRQGRCGSRRDAARAQPVRKARIEGKTGKGVEAKIAQAVQGGRASRDYLKAKRPSWSWSGRVHRQHQPSGEPRGIAPRRRSFSFAAETDTPSAEHARAPSPVPLPDAPTPILISRHLPPAVPDRRDQKEKPAP